MARGEGVDSEVVLSPAVNTLGVSSRLPPLSKEPVATNGLFPSRTRGPVVKPSKSRQVPHQQQQQTATSNLSNLSHVYRIKSGKENHVYVYDPFKPHSPPVMADSRKIHTPVSTNNPEEYATRFKSTKTQKPKVVAFDGKSVYRSNGRFGARGVNGFFPPVKLRQGSDRDSAPMTSRNNGRHVDQRRTPPFVLELAPETAPSVVPTDTASVQTAPARQASGKSGKSGKSTVSKVSRRSNGLASIPPVYPHIIEDADHYDDLAFIPKPKMMISRDNPWVYRFKVKRSMNELSKVMASRPPQNRDLTFIH